jgi:hypothetical protein
MKQDRKSKNEENLEQIRSDLTTFFNNLGREVRSIYRTSQSKFGDESPHNLIPTNLSKTRITIFLDFKDENFSVDNLNRVVAFPKNRSKELPMIEKSRSNLPKVDLERLPSKYIYRDLDELKSHYKYLLP